MFRKPRKIDKKKQTNNENRKKDEKCMEQRTFKSEEFKKKHFSV